MRSTQYESPSGSRSFGHACQTSAHCVMDQVSVRITITGHSTQNCDQSCPACIKPDAYVGT